MPEPVKPELEAAFIDEFTQFDKKLRDVAKSCGMSPRTASTLSERLRRRYLPVKEEIKHFKQKEMVDQLEKKMSMALEYMDELAFAGASLKDIAITFGILAEKRQLLSHRPTQIITVEERRAMNEIIPEILKEAGRRGITIDQYQVEGQAQAEMVEMLPDFSRERETNLTRRKTKINKAVEKEIEA